MQALFVRLRDVVAVTGLSRTAIYQHLRRGELDRVRVNGRTHIGLESVARILPLAGRGAVAPATIDHLARHAVTVETGFDGREWLERWRALGGVMRQEADLVIGLPIDGEHDPDAAAARIAHLRAGLRDARTIAQIREAAKAIGGA